MVAAVGSVGTGLLRALMFGEHGNQPNRQVSGVLHERGPCSGENKVGGEGQGASSQGLTRGDIRAAGSGQGPGGA